MKINEYNDEYYNELQARLNKKRDPWRYDGSTHYTNKPDQDTEIEKQDWIISKFIVGDIPYEDAQKKVVSFSKDHTEAMFWLAELVKARRQKEMG